ncbi:hypothetical protein KKD62_03835 [Patescibacteria group bacterium]|nr:hypothetical protein [Patescibacteria group bacterium]MBU1931137.1 hypothetical protein [Patescibacteria group bacterium]
MVEGTKSGIRETLGNLWHRWSGQREPVPQLVETSVVREILPARQGEISELVPLVANLDWQAELSPPTETADIQTVSEEKFISDTRQAVLDLLGGDEERFSELSQERPLNGETDGDRDRFYLFVSRVLLEAADPLQEKTILQQRAVKLAVALRDSVSNTQGDGVACLLVNRAGELGGRGTVIREFLDVNVEKQRATEIFRARQLEVRADEIKVGATGDLVDALREAGLLNSDEALGLEIKIGHGQWRTSGKQGKFTPVVLNITGNGVKRIAWKGDDEGWGSPVGLKSETQLTFHRVAIDRTIITVGGVNLLFRGNADFADSTGIGVCFIPVRSSPSTVAPTQPARPSLLRRLGPTSSITQDQARERLKQALREGEIIDSTLARELLAPPDIARLEYDKLVPTDRTRVDLVALTTLMSENPEGVDDLRGIIRSLGIVPQDTAIESSDLEVTIEGFGDLNNKQRGDLTNLLFARVLHRWLTMDDNNYFTQRTQHISQFCAEGENEAKRNFLLGVIRDLGETAERCGLQDYAANLRRLQLDHLANAKAWRGLTRVFQQLITNPTSQALLSRVQVRAIPAETAPVAPQSKLEITLPDDLERAGTEAITLSIGSNLIDGLTGAGFVVGDDVGRVIINRIRDDGYLSLQRWGKGIGRRSRQGNNYKAEVFWPKLIEDSMSREFVLLVGELLYLGSVDPQIFLVESYSEAGVVLVSLRSRQVEEKALSISYQEADTPQEAEALVDRLREQGLFKTEENLVRDLEQVARQMLATVNAPEREEGSRDMLDAIQILLGELEGGRNKHVAIKLRLVDFWNPNTADKIVEALIRITAAAQNKLGIEKPAAEEATVKYDAAQAIIQAWS